MAAQCGVAAGDAGREAACVPWGKVIDNDSGSEGAPAKADVEDAYAGTALDTR